MFLLSSVKDSDTGYKKWGCLIHIVGYSILKHVFIVFMYKNWNIVFPTRVHLVDLAALHAQQVHFVLSLLDLGPWVQAAACVVDHLVQADGHFLQPGAVDFYKGMLANWHQFKFVLIIICFNYFFIMYCWLMCSHLQLLVCFLSFVL